MADYQSLIGSALAGLVDTAKQKVTDKVDEAKQEVTNEIPEQAPQSSAQVNTVEEAVDRYKAAIPELASFATDVANNATEVEPDDTFVGDNGYIQDLVQQPQQQAAPHTLPPPELEEDEWVNDLGQIQGANQLNVGPDYDYYNTFDQETNDRYQQAFDKEAQQAYTNRDKNAPIVGEGGYLIDPLSGQATGNAIEMGRGNYQGKDVIDDLKTDADGNRIGFTEEDARSAYMTPEAARWYAENGYFEDAEGALDYIENNPQAEAISKQKMEDNFGFKRFERNAGERIADDMNGANEGYMDLLNGIANGRENIANHFTANLEGGKQVEVNKELRDEMARKLEEREATSGYKLGDTGQILTFDQMAQINQETGTTPFILRNGNDWYLSWDDGGDTAIWLGNGDKQPTLDKIERQPITTSDGTTWTDQDIVDNFKDFGIIKWFVDMPEDNSEYANAVKEAQKEAGSKADFGFLNMRKPREYMGGLTETIGSGNLVDLAPQITDMALTSLPYFNPITAGITGASQMAGDAQGVQMMARDSDSMGTVDNTATAVPLQGLATVGESVLGGAAAGRAGMKEGTRGLYETIGDKAWSKIAKRPGTPNPFERNAATRVAREGIDEGLEEVTTSPLYEWAESGIGQGYANEEKDKYGWETGQKDREGTTGRQHFDNWLHSIPDDFLGGFMLGAPLGGLGELNPRTRREKHEKYNLDKEIASLGIRLPSDEERSDERMNNG